MVMKKGSDGICQRILILNKSWKGILKHVWFNIPWRKKHIFVLTLGNICYHQLKTKIEIFVKITRRSHQIKSLFIPFWCSDALAASILIFKLWSIIFFFTNYASATQTFWAKCWSFFVKYRLCFPFQISSLYIHTREGFF